jgi:hypothetical protein
VVLSIKFISNHPVAIYYKTSVVMFDTFSSAKKIPLYPPLSKGDGEIFDSGNLQRIKL